MKKHTPTGAGGRASLYAGAGFAAMVLAIAAPASAQNADETITTGTTETAEEPGAIVVTGSRIRRDEFSTVEPITVITSQEITQAGFNSAADALQSGAVTQGSGQINNYYAGFVTDGGTGANTLGLRGLGPNRTLILLNGRRLAPGGSRGSVVAADLNVLPTAIIDRIEILKAGASSVYGSDAVAGVVNIITDSSLRGFHVEAQANVPQIGAGSSYRISGSFGFETDRLNVIGSVEYLKRNRVSRNDQSWFDCPVGGYLTGEGTAFGSGDSVGANGSPCFTLDNGGVTINTLGVPTGTYADRMTGVLGRYNRLVPDASAPGGYAGVTYYTRDTFDPIQEEEDLVTPVEIYTGFLQANYDLDMLGDAELYGEALVTRRKSSSYLYRQLSMDYPTGSPLLPTQFRNGVFLNANNTSNGSTVAARAFVGYGLTDSSQKVDYARIGGGLRGNFFMPDWRYDFYVGKSWNDATYNIESFLTNRIAQSFDVVDNGDGTFSCRVSDPNCVAAPYLTADVIGGNLSDEYRDWILDNTVGTTKFRETTFSFAIDGPLFSLPGGDAQLALGAEYRKQRIDDTPDDEAINGNLYGLTASVPTRGTDSVKEVFGELYLPLLADRKFFHNLALTGSARYTDYDSYGSDVTYKIAAEWEMFRGFGLRGSYGTSYRAPALAEQFLGTTSGFASPASDPCDDGNFPANAANYSATQRIIAANCAAQGLNVATFSQNSSVTVFRQGGAETGLSAETSRNWTVGAVVRPPLPQSIGSLSLSLDYFDIKVKNGVSDLSGATILNRCYSATNFDPTEGFCRFVTRNSNNQLTVVSSFINLSEDIVKGYEFNARFATDAIGGRLTLNANVTKYTEQSSRLFPEEYLADANGILTSPDWVGSFDASYAFNRVTLRYGLDWVDGDRDKTYKYLAYDNLTGTVDTDQLEQFKNDYYLEASSYFLHSLSAQFDIAEDFEITVGVRNMFNKKPPRISADKFTLVGNSPLYSGYDYVGRSFFANAAFKF